MSDSEHRKSVRSIHNIIPEIGAADGRSDGCAVVVEAGRDDVMQFSPCAEVLVGENGSSGVDQPADEDELHAEVEEEVAKVAQLPTYSPSRSEIEENHVTDTPYRPW